MKDTTMPTTEAGVENERELVAYELAYHVLPTVAEGEVASITAELKKMIESAGGEVFDEEEAERFELAYEIEKHLEGRYRRFSSAYFGWVRFRLAGAALAEVTEAIESHKSILRILVIKLTKDEEASSFSFHESIADIKARSASLITDDVESEEVVMEEVEAIVETSDETAEEVVK